MENQIKFTEEELQSIAKLQSGYQQGIYALGQVDLEKIDLEQQLEQNSEKKKQVLENWKKLQEEESNILNTLSQKYGDGVLNLKDGTFKPNPKSAEGQQSQ